MWSAVSSVLLVAAVSSLVAAQSGYGAPAASPFPPFAGDPFKKYSLSATGIKADFIPYGARLTNLWVHDKYGKLQDVAVGYDSGKEYLHDTETNHTYFGAVVGRYANRIKNGTFTIDGTTSHIPTNENGGKDTLHGGSVGYDQANWTVVSHTTSSITFSFYDQHMSGFPGDVLNMATYTLADDHSFTSRLVSIPVNHETPIMLSHHIYWNLGAFVDEDALTILNNTLYLPYADRRIDTDGILVPNGQISLTKNTPLDFTSPGGTNLGAQIARTTGECGTGCIGIDNAFLLDRNPYAGPHDPSLEVLRLRAPGTGIQLSVRTDQAGLQIYTCNGETGTIAVKRSQQHFRGATTHVQKHGCIVIETQDWIDGINNQQWGRNAFQVFDTAGPPAVNIAKFTFSVVDDA